jgi:cyclase
MASEGVITRTQGFFEGKTSKVFKSPYTLILCGEETWIIPYPGAHSEEDLIIYFAESGVVHMGALLLSQSFPSVGSNVVEYLELVDIIINAFPVDTVFISGHGKNYKLADVVNYQRMLLSSIEIVRNRMKTGKSVKELRRENVLMDSKKWDSYIRFLNTDYWIEAVYNSYRAKQEGSFSSELDS